MIAVFPVTVQIILKSYNLGSDTRLLVRRLGNLGKLAAFTDGRVVSLVSLSPS